MALTWFLVGLLGGLMIGILAGWLASRLIERRRRPAAQTYRPEPQATATADTTTSSRSAPPHIAAVNSALAGQLPALEIGQPASDAPAEEGGAREDSVAATQPTGVAPSSVSRPLSPIASPSDTEASAQPSLGEETDPQPTESRGPIDPRSSTEAKAADSPDLEAASRRLIEELERRYGSQKAEPRRPGS